MQPNTRLKSGVIEGFFGKPWSWSARQATPAFLTEYGYQFYVYAPKAEPFLRRQWREPLPDSHLHQLSELSRLCHQHQVQFGIGLTPHEIYLNYDASAQACLRAKVQQLNDVGTDILCILFDDMRGDVDQLATTQARIVADVCGWSNAQHFIACPTYYSHDPRLTQVFGPPPANYWRDFGRAIDPRVDIFWTGEKIISPGYSTQHLTEVAAELGRKPFIWDNAIANDSRVRTNHLFLDPSADSWHLATNHTAGLAINPMNQPHLSRIALSAFRELLQGFGSRPDFAAICRRLCEPPLADYVVEDVALFHDRDLSSFGPETHSRLTARYEGLPQSPYAQEVVVWLRGEYAFDPDCLTA